MQVGQLVTIAWICFFGTSALFWALTSTFFSHVLGVQNQVLRVRVTSYLQKANIGTTDADQFLIQIGQADLQIVPLPNIADSLMAFRYRIIVGMVFSGFLAVIPIIFEVMLGGSPMKLEGATEFYRYVSGSSIILDLLLILLCFAAPARWGMLIMLGEVLHWRAIIAAFRNTEAVRDIIQKP